MFQYTREKEITELQKQIEKYERGAAQPVVTAEDIVNNALANNKEILDRLKMKLDELLEDKQKKHKAYNRVQREERTKEAQIKHKALIEEYHAALSKVVSIGANNIIEGDFCLNDYTEFNQVRGTLQKHLHMATVGLERIQRQVKQ